MEETEESWRILSLGQQTIFLHVERTMGTKYSQLTKGERIQIHALLH
jgi:hypothetical protein